MTGFWRKWFKGTVPQHQGMFKPFPWKRERKSRRPSTRLSLEILEERVVLDSGGAAGLFNGAHLVYGGGPLISSVSVQSIFVQDSGTGSQTSAANRAQFDSFFNKITSDGWLASQLHQYSAPGFTIGNGTVGTDDLGGLYAPNTTAAGFNSYSDAFVQTIVRNEIAAGRTAAPTANTVYFVFTPPGDASGDDSNFGNSVNAYFGYHSNFVIGANTNVYYAVIPDEITTAFNVNAIPLGFNGFQGMTQTAAHELAEAITDPQPSSGWTEGGANFIGLDGGEVADHGGNSATIQDGFSVQQIWSNALTDLAHSPTSGPNDLYINQIAAPAVTAFNFGPIATFTDLNTSLTASQFSANVTDNNGTWTNVTITGSNGFFAVNGTPPSPLTRGQVGSPFNSDGLQVIVSTSPVNFTNPPGSPTVLKASPYVVSNTAPLTYIADSGSGPNNFVLTEAGTNFQLSDNGLVVFTQPISSTTNINITAAPTVPGDAVQNVDDSLTIDYSGGTFTNAVNFDGGPGSGAHSITLKGGSFGSDTYTPTSSNSGSVTLSNGQTITFTRVSSVVDTDTAANFTIDGTSGADQINVVNGAAVSGASATTQVSSGNGTFAAVTFANKTTATIQGLTGADTFTLNNTTAATGLTTLNVDGGSTAGVVFNVQATPAAVVTNVLGGGASVAVNVGNAGSVQGIMGTVNVDNSTGAQNNLTVDDSADSTTRIVTLTSGTIHGIAPADIKYVSADTNSVAIDGGSAGNFFDVQTVGSGAATTLNGGTGNDTFNVLPQATGVNLTVNGQAPTSPPGDTLVTIGPGTLNPGATGSGTISQVGHATVTYTGIETVNVGASLSLTTVSVSPTSIQEGRDTATVTLTALDAKDNQESSGGLTVAFAPGNGNGKGTFSAVTDNHNGTYTATFSGTIVGTNTITATIGGQAVTSTPPTITVTLGPVSLSQSTVTASPSTIQSGSTSTITLQTVDNNGNDETSGGFSVSFGLGTGTASGTFSTVTDHNDGTYTATFTGTTAGSNTITATIGGQAVTSTPPTITVTVGPISLAQSLVSVNPSTILLGGSTTVTLQGRDSGGNNETSGGATVTFNVGTGQANGTFGPVTDNHNGTYTAVFTSSASGTNTITATINGSPVSSTPPTLTVDAAPTITSPSSSTFTLGTTNTFTVTDTGFPAPTLSENGPPLPSGVTFNNATGILSGTPVAGSGGVYHLTFTATNGVGSPATQNFTLTVNHAPAITSLGSTTFTVGTAGTFTVTATGFPQDTLTEVGMLPAGVTFLDNGNGTATLAGTPNAGTGGIYSFTITASNGVAPDATQTFTLTVNEAPSITSSNTATFLAGQAGTFTVATGHDFPSATTLRETGALPAGVTFTDNGNGTATLAGTPNAGAGGSYSFTITAANGVAPDATQTFTLTVNEAPSITSSNTATFHRGQAGTFTVTTGHDFPSATTLRETGALPAGLTFTDNGNGTATLTGTLNTGGAFSLTITAANGVAPDATQQFTLTVDQVPAITSATGMTLTEGIAGTFTVTDTGFPTPALSENGTLPGGVTFNNTTGVLSGTPTVGSAGSYPVTFTASNGVGSDATQNFTLVVNPAPAITSPNTTEFLVGTPSSFVVTTRGVPTPVLTESGALPRGVGFDAATGVLSGTPALGTGGQYLLTFTAANGVGKTATQSFDLVVQAPPTVTSTAGVTFPVLVASSYTITSGGSPVTGLWESGTLPTGVTFNSSTGVLSGTPALGTAGTYALTFTDTYGVGSDTTQVVYLTVANRPALKTDTLGAYNPSDGSWALDSDGQPSFGPNDQEFLHFSPPGVTGVAGDWTGNGITEIGDFSNGVWHLDLAGTGAPPGANETFQFGQAGDIPVVGDWDGNPTGRDELGVFRTAPDGITGEFILDIANHHAMDSSNLVFTFGYGTDHIIVGDWNGKGTTEVGVYRDAASYIAADAGDIVFSLNSNGDHATFNNFVFGLITDKVVIGDWNGSGTSKIGTYRDGASFGAPGTALFSLDTNGSLMYQPGVSEVFLYGLDSDQFVTGKWLMTPPLLPAEFAAGGHGPGGVPALTDAQLEPVLQQAIADWSAHGADAALLAAVPIHIGHLNDNLIGWTGPDGITLDADAAGWGWYTGLQDNPNSNEMDLLTVVEHELGHELGLSDVNAVSHPQDLMASTLPTGTRRTIGANQ